MGTMARDEMILMLEDSNTPNEWIKTIIKLLTFNFPSNESIEAIENAYRRKLGNEADTVKGEMFIAERKLTVIGGMVAGLKLSGKDSVDFEAAYKAAQEEVIKLSKGTPEDQAKRAEALEKQAKEQQELEKVKQEEAEIERKQEQERRRAYAIEAFSSLKLPVCEISSTLKQYGASVELRGENVPIIEACLEKRDYLRLINFLKSKNFDDYPPIEEIKSARETLERTEFAVLVKTSKPLGDKFSPDRPSLILIYYDEKKFDDRATGTPRGFHSIDWSAHPDGIGKLHSLRIADGPCVATYERLDTCGNFLWKLQELVSNLIDSLEQKKRLGELSEDALQARAQAIRRNAASTIHSMAAGDISAAESRLDNLDSPSNHRPHATAASGEERRLPAGDPFAANVAESKYPQLVQLKNELADVENTINIERKRYQDALALINRLTNNKTRGVAQGSRQFYECQAASEIIQRVERGAPELKAKRAELEAKIKDVAQ